MAHIADDSGDTEEAAVDRKHIEAATVEVATVEGAAVAEEEEDSTAAVVVVVEVHSRAAGVE